METLKVVDVPRGLIDLAALHFTGGDTSGSWIHHPIPKLIRTMTQANQASSRLQVSVGSFKLSHVGGAAAGAQLYFTSSPSTGTADASRPHVICTSGAPRAWGLVGIVK